MNEGDVTFREMFRELPVQTSLFSFGPVLLAIAQLFNGVYYGTTLTYHALFGAVMIAFAVLVTRHHLVSFRIRRLERGER